MKNEDVEAPTIIDETLNRVEWLKDVYPYLYLKLFNTINSFFSQVRFTRNIDLYQTDDLASYIIPSDCELLQLAVQVEDSLFKRSMVYVNEELYNRLSDLDKVIFVLHESLYKVFKFEDAKKVRELSYVILSDIHSTMKHDKFIFWAKRYGINRLKLDRATLTVNDNIDFFSNGNIKSADSYPGALVSFKKFHAIASDARVRYYKNGKLEFLMVNIDRSFLLGKKLNYSGRYWFYFNKKGLLVKVLNETTQVQTEFDGIEI